MQRSFFKQGYSLIALFLILIPFQASSDHWGKPKIDGPGPWEENLSTASVKGMSFEIGKKGQLLIRQAGVANLLEYKGVPRVYFQWLPTVNNLHSNFDHVAFMDLRNEKWSAPRVVNIPFADKPKKYPVDPTVVKLPNGDLRMYFTSVRKKGTFIGSAISSDGFNFLIEKGKRLKEDNVDFKDCAVVFYKEKWHMITPSHNGDGQGFYATSSDGLNFTRESDVRVKAKGDWLGNMVITGGEVYFFGTGFVAKTNNFNDWELTSKHRLQDPAAIFFKDKTIVVSTTE